MTRLDRSWLPTIVVSALFIIVVAVMWEPLPAHFNEPAKPGQRVPAPPQSVSIDDLLAIRGFLLADDWPRLDSALVFNHDSARRDVHYETHYRALMDALDASDPALRPHVDAWVDHEPSSAVAHIARATYFDQLAQAARGTAYENETSRGQRLGMREWQELSRRDLETAKTLDADNVLVYWLELGLAFSGATIDRAALLKEGLAHSPGSLLLPVRRVLLLTPRWGGSVDEMQQYAREAGRARDINPRLATIQGFVNYDAARGLRESNQNDKAVAELTKALEYGEHFEFRHDRGTILYNQGKYEAALDDLDHALAERPGYLDALSLRSVVYEKLAATATGARRAELLSHANADVLNAVALDSTDKDVKWAMKRHGATRALASAAPSPPVSHVIDEAQFLDSYNAVRAEEQLGLIYTESGVDIRVIFAREIPGNLETFALARLRELGIGRDAEARGLLLVYDVAGRRMRMEVGRGLEGILPDGFVGYLMREQTAAFFASGNKALGLTSTLFVISNRLREAALNDRYDPARISYLKDSVRLAAGGGATTSASVGSDPAALATRALSSAALARFAPQPTVAAAHHRYLEALRDGFYQPDLPVYTAATAPVLRRFPITAPYASFILYSEYGHKYVIVERGDIAILYYTSTPFVSTHHFHRSQAGWQVDIAADVRNTREFIGGGYTWAMVPSGDEYARTFADQYVDVDGYLRPLRGDNRRLPNRR
ncbi:MAG: hypothetical protein JWL61_4671 [Gemmatimonadetes bacterium]|nr:hypothetical protein [Gemmatimonadota bacterium]